MTRPTTGWHFLQLPGPSNVPGRVLRALSRPTIDHRGPDFADMAGEVLHGLRWIFRTGGPVVIYPSAGHGGWEAALVNTLDPGDKVLAFETGKFGVDWGKVARELGFEAEIVSGDWRHGVNPRVVEERLTEDGDREIRAVLVLHNETSTGIVSPIPDIRRAMDRADHPALLLVDVISSLGSMEYRHDDWGVDVAVGASQKGLMLPPGLSFVAVGERALEASRKSRASRSYWDWHPVIEANEEGLFPYTPATNLLFGLRESLAMLREEGLERVFARHARHAAATRRAVEAWGLEIQGVNADEHSDVLTAVRVPKGHDADRFRALVRERFDLSLGGGLGKVRGRLFRIGHLGDFNDLMLAATLSGVESGLALAGIPVERGGAEAALRDLEQSDP
ncbi:MAG: pyridoxal-phosphate-dependent aminotransferase family protein [Longimicrobiales bacterium]